MIIVKFSTSLDCYSKFKPNCPVDCSMNSIILRIAGNLTQHLFVKVCSQTKNQQVDQNFHFLTIVNQMKFKKELPVNQLFKQLQVELSPLTEELVIKGAIKD